MKKTFGGFLAVAACLAASSGAFAAIIKYGTTDPLLPYPSNGPPSFYTAGSYFVGKGDIQTACGMNNAQAQAGIPLIVPGSWTTGESEAQFDAVCEWFTGPDRNQRVHHRTKKVKASAIASATAFDTRKSNQITGTFVKFAVDGNGAIATETSGDEIPVVGGPCPGNQGNDGVWISVDLVSSSGNPGDLKLVCPSGANAGNTVVVGQLP